MKLFYKFVLLILPLSLVVLLACEPLDNGGDKDYVEVQVTVEQSEEDDTALQSYTASSVESAAIFAVPASVTLDTLDQIENAYDGQLQDLVNGTVTLTVPLNESIKLVKFAYTTAYTLDQIINSDSESYAFGLSDAFTVSGTDEEKTIAIAMIENASWQFVDGDGTTGINFDPTRSGIQSRPLVYNSGLYITWSEGAAASDSTTDGDDYGQIRVGLWDGSSSWNSGPVANGLNFNNSQLAELSHMVEFDSKIFLTWIEYSSIDNKRKLRLLSRDAAGTGPESGGWTRLDGGGDNGLNYDTAEGARLPNMLAYNSNLYIAWEERTPDVRQIRVARMDGSTKDHVDGGLTEGINYGQVAGNCDNCAVNLIEYNSKLYAVWIELSADSGNPARVRIAEFDGTSSWTFKEPDTAVGLNYQGSISAEGAFPVVFNSKLYITWTESNASSVSQIRVVEWDGTNWAFVDGFGANGLNRDVTKNAGYSSLVVHNSKLYAVWSEVNASDVYQIRMRRWDGGSTWTFVDGDGANGLNKDTTLHAWVPIGIVYSSKLFLTWYEGWDPFNTPATSISQIRVLQTGL